MITTCWIFPLLFLVAATVRLCGNTPLGREAEHPERNAAATLMLNA
jgi:hypothetical protein